MLLALLLGPLGVDQFYAHHWVLAAFKLLTGGGFGIWAFIDCILWIVGGIYGTPGCPGGYGPRVPHNVISVLLPCVTDGAQADNLGALLAVVQIVPDPDPAYVTGVVCRGGLDSTGAAHAAQDLDGGNWLLNGVHAGSAA
ncbi:unnamed protein product [Clonostachys chloroleuca]|uniref:TM2 domain-containing protein n=1 Tax=Clonostachys chloroleuca TaxID=1926264 RepID=A0AA35LTE6_9HYPO|nr:unnamed protein product [Clonostachys chloroleuca]